MTKLACGDERSFLRFDLTYMCVESSIRTSSDNCYGIGVIDHVYLMRNMDE